MTGPRLPLYARVWRDEDRSIQVWRRHLDPNTFVGYFSYLHPFLHAIDKGPDELVPWARSPANMNAVLDAINNHVSGIERRYDTKRLTNASVRSFLMHNRVTLPRDQHSSSADPCHLLRESEDLESRVLELEQAAKREGVSQE